VQLKTKSITQIAFDSSLKSKLEDLPNVMPSTKCSNLRIWHQELQECSRKRTH